MISLEINMAEVQLLASAIGSRDRTSALICSAETGEGASTVAYAVAQRVAASGARTLLVEFNTLHSYCAEVLALPRRSWSLESLDDDAVFCIPGRNLSLLPPPLAGAFPVSEQNERSLAAAIDRWTRAYDMVIVDGPPILEKTFSGVNGLMLAKTVDAVFLVVASGATPSARILDAAGRLASVGAPAAGVIMNDRDMPPLKEEIARQIEKSGDRFPRFKNWLLRRVNRARLLDLEF